MNKEPIKLNLKYLRHKPTNHKNKHTPNLELSLLLLAQKNQKIQAKKSCAVSKLCVISKKHLISIEKDIYLY